MQETQFLYSMKIAKEEKNVQTEVQNMNVGLY